MDRNLLPWVLSSIVFAVALGEGVALVGRSGGPAAPRRAAPVTCPLEECRRLRRSLAVMESERGVLRAELDRQRQLVQMKAETNRILTKWGADKLTDDDKRAHLGPALAKLKELMPDLAKGEPKTFEALQEVYHTMLMVPMEVSDAAPFREAYEQTDDPYMKGILLSHFAGRDPQGSKQLVLDELQRSQDPYLRKQLIWSLKAITPADQDAAVAQAFLSAAQNEPDFQARNTAVEALSTLSTPEAADTLLQVAMNDPNGEVRETAIRSLAGNVETRPKLLELLAKEPDERLRTIGDCTAKLSAG